MGFELDEDHPLARELASLRAAVQHYEARRSLGISAQ
jgi:hypothetical protein